jgi:hypothetical protein
MLEELLPWLHVRSILSTFVDQKDIVPHFVQVELAGGMDGPMPWPLIPQE